MKPDPARTPLHLFLWDAFVIVVGALLTWAGIMTGRDFVMLAVLFGGIRWGVSIGKRAALLDLLTGRAAPPSDRPPPPEPPGDSARYGSDGGHGPKGPDEPPSLPPSSAAVSIARAVRYELRAARETPRVALGLAGLVLLFSLLAAFR
jgi:hypothetical protein